MELWIARDYTGLWAFSKKPNKNCDVFTSPTIDCKVYQLDSELFPEVKFENSPQQIELKFVKEELI